MTNLMMLKNKHKQEITSPVRLLFIVVSSIYIGELFVMFLLSIFPIASTKLEMFVDASLLTIIVFPIIYLFSFKPIKIYIAELKHAEKTVEKNLQQLKDVNEQLLIAEKMASVGKLAAGVAHEINNPIAFVSSNIGTLRKYIERILKVTHEYESILTYSSKNEVPLKKISTLRKSLNFGKHSVYPFA